MFLWSLLPVNKKMMKREKKTNKPGSCSKRTIIVNYLLIFCVDVVIPNWCGLAVLEEWKSSLSPIPLYGIDIYDYCVIQLTDLAYSMYLEDRVCKTRGHIYHNAYMSYIYIKKTYVWYVWEYVGSAFFPIHMKLCMSFPKSGARDARLSHHQMCSLSCAECGKDPGPRGTEPLLGMSKIAVPNKNCRHICNPCLYTSHVVLLNT